MTGAEFGMLTAGCLLGEGYTVDEVRRILRIAHNSRLLRVLREFDDSRRKENDLVRGPPARPGGRR